MVRFIIGAAGSGKTERVLELMRVTYEKTSKRIILLVPEQQTVIYETLLAERFLPEAALRVEAMSFTRLANAVARQTGGLSGASVTAGAKALLTWRAMASVWDSLRSISSDARGAKGQLVPRISAAREEMKANAVTPDLIEKALAKARENGEDSDPAFSKLSDLFLVSSAYEALVREEFGDTYSENSLVETVERGAEAGFFENTEIFIDSFFSVTKEEFKVIAEMIRGADVTVTVSLGDERSPLPHEIPAKRFYDLIASFAYRYTDLEVERLGASRRASTKELYAVSTKLFDYGDTASAECELPSVPDSVRVFSVKDRYEEAEAAASVIEAIVRNGGRYSDIAVIAGDLGALDGVAENCFDRHSIPCFRTDPTPLESGPLARHFISLLRIVGSWRREDVIRLVKTGLTSLTDEEACSFELYTEIWGIRGRRMFSSPWSMNPSGYSKTTRDGDKALLAAANDAREKLIPPIDAFVSVFDGGDADVADICEALIRYTEESGLYTALTARSRALFSAGDKDGAAREIDTFRKFCACFDEIVKYLPGVRCDAEGFSSILRFAMTDAGAGAIPTGVDEIALGSAATVRTGAVRHVILLGCVEGEFPGTVSDSGFFNDTEKVTLEGAGIALLPESDERDAMELLRFHRSASLPSDSLTLFVPSSSFGDGCTPSIGAERLLSVLGREKAVPFSSLPLEERLFSRAGIDAAIRSASLRADGEEEKLLRDLAGGEYSFVPALPEEARVSAETAGKVFGGNIILSQTKMTGYARCPFSYYVEHVLKIGETKKAEISPLDRGNFVHNVLEGFFSRTKKEDYPLGRERTEEICDAIIGEYLDGIFGGEPINEKIRYLFVNLRRSAILFVEAVQREIAQSKFEIFSTELGFGFKGMPESMKVALPDGSFVAFNGKIDRLDAYRSGNKTYVRVVDYKTGEKKFDLEKIMKGIDAQLLIYLFSVWHTKDAGLKEGLGGEEILPAGAIYFYIPSGAKKEDGYKTREQGTELVLGTVKRDGVYLSDDEVIEAMDKGFSGVYAPVPAGRGKPKNEKALKTLEELGGICEELEDAVAAIAGRMKSGDCGARPEIDGDDSPCNWCSGAKVCRSAVIKKRR
ncbi:MAG: PD-(D/E)XK nuclease family protein [Clostridia bacterium]|nr:PD-(D/E)XK nuclease family protein [Clostridia bacterium]